MANILQIMRESNSELLKAEASDLSKWSKLRHVKKDFELFLQFNIAEIQFKTKDKKDSSVICTSNTALIKILQTAEPENKQKYVKLRGPSIRTKDKNSIMTWDIRDKKYKTISLESWQIANFISITKDNVLILDELINKLLM